MNTIIGITPEKVTVRHFYERAKGPLELELISGEAGLDNEIKERSLNRPALALTGYLKHFGNNRLQLFGAGELAYLEDVRFEKQESVLTEIFKRTIPGIIVSRGNSPTPILKKLSEEYKVPILRSKMKSKDFTAEATIFLDQLFAPVSNMHGTLMDIRGVGVLLTGESGVGKSECALALIERGYSLVADDYVVVKLVGENFLSGCAKDKFQGYMECRGIGIINVASMFGIRSVRKEKTIDLVVSLVLAKEGVEEDRTGLETKEIEIMGQRIPHFQIVVRSGRDIARLVEVAVMVHSLRKNGHDPAQEFEEMLLGLTSKNSI